MRGRDETVILEAIGLQAFIPSISVSQEQQATQLKLEWELIWSTCFDIQPELPSNGY